MSTMRKKKKCNNSCAMNTGCHQKKEKEVYCDPCKKPVHKKCEPCKPIEPCKKVDSCKEMDIVCKKHEFACCPPGPCEDCEIKFDDTCAKLAEQAEKLFKKALNCECLATESYEEAREFDKKAKALEAKAKRLAKESLENECEADKLRKQANDLLCRSEELCEKAKC